MVVRNFTTGEILSGNASAELVRESEAAAPTGAVMAYRDEAGVWQYVAERDASFYRSQGHDVIVVYVDGVSRFVVATDAVSTTIAARDADEAAAAFARTEKGFDDCESVAELAERAESFGGWARVTEA